MAVLRKFALLVIAASFLLAPAVEGAEAATVAASEVYYDIGGNTVPAIANSIRHNMPPKTNGFVGLTAFIFTWRYDYALVTTAAGRVCRVNSAHVTIEVKTYLPRHASIRQAPPAIREQWKAYSVALKRHEGHHATDFIAIGSAIPAALDAVQTRDCSTIEAVANAVGQDYVERAQAKGDDYDAITDHGMNQGASWPGL